ncbi:permease-like cell division protein FtsX [Actinomadura kijaniata]|uniref:permease-like cell division protein FtsX n=1 Tax=Actinomadura kijaniata TaxID=46161 RepID=UPI0008312B5A|nr:permease-like cell division protein FtsX [Actinomadura kijaniata]
MNRTEERLTDALRGVGEVLEPGDVPAPDFGRRRRFAWRPAMAVAGAALAVTAAVGTGVALTGDDGDRKVTLTTPADKGVRAVIFLCTKTSTNRLCSKKDVTPAQREEVKKALRALPAVRQVEYENRDAAYERFKERFRDSPSFADATKPGDIPESFRVRLDGVSDFSELRKVLIGRPGIDQIILESPRFRIRLCTKGSAGSRCDGRSATVEQLRGLERWLEALPGEVDLVYEVRRRAVSADGPARSKVETVAKLLEKNTPVVLHVALDSDRALTAFRAITAQPGVNGVLTD